MEQADIDNELFLMFDGTKKRQKDLVIGDILMSDDSTPCSILYIVPIYEETYVIKPTKGESFIVGESHTLSLNFSGALCCSWSNALNTYTVKWFNYDKLKYNQKTFSVYKYETKENAYEEVINFKNSLQSIDFFDVIVRKFVKLVKSLQKQCKIYKTLLIFPYTDIEFDPYVIGYWLGDGTSCRSEITTADPEIVEYFTEYFKQFNLYLKPNPTKPITYRISSGKKGRNYKGKNRFLEYLQEKDLIDNKHIPLELIHTSRENRLRLLAGLIDSDGSLSSNCYDFVQKRENLLDDVVYLCRSLGFACYKKECEKTCTNGANGPVTGTYYRIAISGEGLEEIPCLLERKQATSRKQIKDVLVVGMKVTKLDNPLQTYRIMTDKPRFLMADLTVRCSYKRNIADCENI